MAKPSSDRGGMQQVIRALKAVGWELCSVGGEAPRGSHKTERVAIEAVEDTGDEWVYFTKGTHPNGAPLSTGAVRFVLGNDPEEVVCDYTMTAGFHVVLDTLTSSWWD